MKRLLVALALAPLCVGVAFATVNVNSAQQSELIRVKGIDRQKAKTIIEHRARNGAYDSLDDLEKLPGFGHDLVMRISPEIAFTGDAYTPPKTAPKKDEKKK